MCIAAPGKVISIVNKMAKISYPGGIENKAMVMEVVPKVGDYVLVQMGIVLRILSKEEVRASRSAWSETTS
jgi:hydrogenase assembly chaperone HypC/HupF